MKYMGGKNRLAPHLLPIILNGREDHQWYVEPFVGGCNMIDKVGGWRIGGEFNQYVANMWISLANGWLPMTNVNRELYSSIMNNKDLFDIDFVGWAGVGCSYNGKWFGGYSGVTNTKHGVRDYQDEAYRNLIKQIDKIKDVYFFHSSYEDLIIPPDSVIYCDPPYGGTTGYKDDFDNGAFWDWCRVMAYQGHKIFISEYKAPDDFTCVWSKEFKSTLSAGSKSNNVKKSIEKLFTII